MNKSLTVYKASAGSGKTFTLAIEYIKLLISDPQSYRRILAVTFTNKAMEEMKMRILSQLYGIWKQLPDSRSYIEKICQSMDITPDYASRQAGIALGNLIHNYSYFRIETIDSFFQSIFRNLARELDLTTNMRIGLNDYQVEEQAVDKIIEQLDTTNEVLFWIIGYINERIADDKGWNVISEIKKFGKTIFNDKYKDSSEQLREFLDEKGKFESYVKTIRHEHNNAKERMRAYGESFMDAINAANLTMDNFKYNKSGIYGYFQKLVNGVFDEKIVGKRIMECLENPEMWYNKKDPMAGYIHTIVCDDLHAILRASIEDRPKQWMRYKSAELTLKHLNQLRLLNIIEKKVRELNTEANRFLLSDTQHLLQSLIDGNDSPFIYEKTGSYIRHIMIDEFQDTSTVQWKNFKVLMLDCMSNDDSHNLIVGDVKQSIYRWRSGDWTLLNNITDEFGKNSKMLELISLDTNYRSEAKIIAFNNAFFNQAAKSSECKEIAQAYSDVAQKVPEGKQDNGYVRIDLLPSEDYAEETLRSTKDFIVTLLDKGTSQNDIAILVRLNSNIPTLANYLQSELADRDINIVSDEAFKLGASVAVGMIISSLRLLIHPDDNLEKAKLAKAYRKHALKDSKLDDDSLLTDGCNIGKWLPEEFTEHRESLLRMPLYDLCQHLHNILGINEMEGQESYLAAFYDKLLAFITDKTPDINLFLKEWDENMCNENIQGTELNGIRLMSIHKSKGLEFDNVIIPFCDWRLEKSSGNVMLCHTSKMPYGELPLIPVDYNTMMKSTVYEDDYLREKAQNEVDNMNLLYVAFTRASCNLYVIGKHKSSATISEVIEGNIDGVCRVLESSVCNIPDDVSSPTIVEYGELYVKNKQKKEESKNVFLRTAESQRVSIQPRRADIEFRQSNDSIRFTKNDDSTDEGKQYIKLGLILHEVLSTIKTISDIDHALEQLEQQGVLYDETITNKRIKELLGKRLNDKRVAEWFSDKWDVINETAILWKDPMTGKMKERRPDRVMVSGKEAWVVDFKFGNHKPDYIEQVSEYSALLRDMGYESVKGFIWYVYSNKIVEV